MFSALQACSSTSELIENDWLFNCRCIFPTEHMLTVFLNKQRKKIRPSLKGSEVLILNVYQSTIKTMLITN